MQKPFFNQNRGNVGMGNPEPESNVVGLEILCWIIFAGLFVIFSAEIFPVKYYYDSQSIMARFHGLNEYMDQIDQSYDRVSDLYLFIGVDANVSFTAQRLLGGAWASFIFLITFYGLGRKKFLSWWMVIVPLLVGYFVYMGQLSKEHVPLFVVSFLIIRGLGRNVVFVITLILIILYSAYFRQYWFLVGSLWVGLISFQYFKLSKKMQFFLVGLMVFLMCILFSYFRGGGITDMRELVNISRDGASDAQTAFSNILPNTNPFFDFINIAYSIVILCLPISIGYAGIQALVFQIYQPIFLIIFIIAGRKLWLLAPTGAILKLRLGYLLWVSFGIVQAMFEPDLGSYFRHQMPFFPIIASILWVTWGVSLKELQAWYLNKAMILRSRSVK